nr:hypothetical protein 2 [Coxiellaceae bacterium]
MPATINIEQLRRWGYRDCLCGGNLPADLPDYRYILYAKENYSQWEIVVSHPHQHRETIVLPDALLNQESIRIFIEEKSAQIENGLTGLVNITLPDPILQYVIDNIKKFHWQCISLDNKKVTDYKSQDFTCCNYCVHTDTIPLSPLELDKDYAIQQPVLCDDGGVYNLRSLEKTYGKKYEQSLYRCKPDDGACERLFALYREQETWKIFAAHAVGNHEEIIITDELLNQKPEINDFLLQQEEKLAGYEDTDSETDGSIEDEEHNNQKVEDICFPFSLANYLFAQCELPIDKGLLIQSNSEISNERFSPNQYRNIQFACRTQFQSKLKPDMYFSPEKSIVGIFRSENCEDDTVMMIEKTEKHGEYYTGRIDVYQFKAGNTENNQMNELRIKPLRSLDYATLTQENLLRIYHLKPQHCEGRVRYIKPENLAKLEEKMQEQQKKIDEKLIRYAYRSGKLWFNLLGFLLGIEYHNAATLFISTLSNSGIFRSEQFDPRFRVITEPDWKTGLFGQTPAAILPTPETTERLEHTP